MSLLHCSPPQALYSLLDDNAKRTPAGQALKQSELQQRINYAEFEKIQGEDFFRQARGQSQQFDIKEASLSPDLYSLGRYHRDTLLASPVSLANCSPEIDSDVQIIVPRQPVAGPSRGRALAQQGSHTLIGSSASKHKGRRPTLISHQRDDDKGEETEDEDALPIAGLPTEAYPFPARKAATEPARKRRRRDATPERVVAEDAGRRLPRRSAAHHDVSYKILTPSELRKHERLEDRKAAREAKVG